MEAIGARFGQDVDHARGRSSDFSGVQIGLDLELLDRVDRWAHADSADEALIVVHPVDHVVIRHRVLRVD